MTGKELSEQLKKLSYQGTKHRHLVDKGKQSAHKGYDVAEDESLINIYFNDGIVVIAPYNQVSFYKSEEEGNAT